LSLGIVHTYEHVLTVYGCSIVWNSSCGNFSDIMASSVLSTLYQDVFTPFPSRWHSSLW